MRKSIIFALVVMCIGIVGCQSICAQSLTDEQEKEIKEQAKAEAKRLQEENWVYQGPDSLEAALYNYYVKTAEGQAFKAVPQTVTDAHSVMRGEAEARTKAEVAFAREMRAVISSKIDALKGGEEVNVESKTVERKITAELNGTVVKYFTLYKEERPRNYTVCVYFASPNLDSPTNSDLISKAVEKELEQAKKIDESADSE
ncbi:MAG: hypothetical protein LUD17_14590 [Bacteroidales bacterium]|nr:hypothetical protein [Bacteroidales bacterium]